jgi:hypothetical protein
MTDSEIKQILKEELARNCQSCMPPELDDADLEALILGAQTATIWLPDTVYPAGSFTVPDALSATRYKAITGGTSGATPPSWPTYPPGWSGNPTAFYSCCYSSSWWGGGAPTITDGTVTWQAAGMIDGLYDLAAATADGWLLKCAKASTLVQSSSAGQSTQLQQVFDHCQRMAAHWQPYKVG